MSKGISLDQFRAELETDAQKRCDEQARTIRMQAEKIGRLEEALKIQRYDLNAEIRYFQSENARLLDAVANISRDTERKVRVRYNSTLMRWQWVYEDTGEPVQAS